MPTLLYRSQSVSPPRVKCYTLEYEKFINCVLMKKINGFKVFCMCKTRSSEYPVNKYIYRPLNLNKRRKILNSSRNHKNIIK